MSQRLINHSPDLKRLAEEGYAFRIVSGHLLVEQIPYLNKLGEIKRGVFACPLDATDDSTVPPSDHVMSFSGEQPCDRNGNVISGLGQAGPRCSSLDKYTFQHGFSNKPKGANGQLRPYIDFYEKVRTYEDIIVGAVHTVDSTVTARVGALPQSETENGPFAYPDSASARAGTTDLTGVFVNEVIAHIGLGGTGGYILDHVSKTPVKQSLLVDGDLLLPHNTFRSPGAPQRSEMQPPPFKVNYHASRNSLLKRNIVPYAVYMSEEYFHLLDGVTFAFVAIDPCPEKKSIIAELERRKLPFVDVGMGLYRASNGIGGTLRAVLSTPKNRDVVRPYIPMESSRPDGVYENTIQISDLNSQNANMAVQLWKGFRGFYADFSEPIWHYQLESRQIIKSAA